MIRSWRNSGIRFERNVVLKIQNYVERNRFPHLYLMFIFRQLDNEYENDRQEQIMS